MSKRKRGKNESQRQKEWRERNPNKWKEYAATIMVRNRVIIDMWKNVPCMDCGQKFPSYCMDFDHREPEKKRIAIAKLLACGSLRYLVEEMEKCDVVCAICHRVRTHGWSQEEE